MQTRENKGARAQAPSSVSLGLIKNLGIPYSKWISCARKFVCVTAEDCPVGVAPNKLGSQPFPAPTLWSSAWKETAYCLAWWELERRAGEEGLACRSEEQGHAVTFAL